MNYYYIFFRIAITFLFSFCFDKLHSQPSSKDSLCYYLDNLQDCGLIYKEKITDIPKFIFKAVKKNEKKRIKIEPIERMNFSEINASDRRLGLVYFTESSRYYFMMLRQASFGSFYLLKIFVKRNFKIVEIKNFKLSDGYQLEELVEKDMKCRWAMMQ